MNTEQPTMTIKSLPTSAWICIWCCVYSRIEDLVRREWCWKGSKEEGDSARPRSLPGSLYASECECQRVGQPARQLDQRRRLSSACAPPSSPAAACNRSLLPSRRHFSLVVRRFPHCLLQEQQQSAINIKCATQVLLRVMKFIPVSLICISCWFGCIVKQFF